MVHVPLGPRAVLVWLTRAGLLGPIRTLRQIALELDVTVQRVAELETAGRLQFILPRAVCPACAREADRLEAAAEAVDVVYGAA
jgi:NMD protein affecting ribosome stability and mRNA decay